MVWTESAFSPISHIMCTWLEITVDEILFFLQIFVSSVTNITWSKYNNVIKTQSMKEYVHTVCGYANIKMCRLSESYKNITFYRDLYKKSILGSFFLCSELHFSRHIACTVISRKFILPIWNVYIYHLIPLSDFVRLSKIILLQQQIMYLSQHSSWNCMIQ